MVQIRINTKSRTKEKPYMKPCNHWQTKYLLQEQASVVLQSSMLKEQLLWSLIENIVILKN